MKLIHGIRLFPMGSVSLGLLAVGCGGGGGSSGNPATSTQTTHVGPVAVSFTGHPQAAITQSSAQVTSVGQAGASYTSLSINPAPNLNSTFLLFTRNISPSGGFQIFTMPPFGSAPATLLVHSGVNGIPAISQSGVISFVNYGLSTNSLDTIKSDGSGQKVVTAVGSILPAISPSGTTIAYLYAGNIWTQPVGGGAPTEIYSGGEAVAAAPVWSPSGSQIAFTEYNPVTDTYNAFTMTSAGASQTNVTNEGLTVANVEVNSWSPDGTTLACAYWAVDSPTAQTLLLSLNGGIDNFLTPTALNDSSPCISPDNQKIAFYRSNAGGAIPGIYVSDFAGLNAQLVLPDPSSGPTGAITSMVWSDFLEGQVFVGAHGTLLGTPVSGFLVSQNGNQFASLLTFTATTPSTATLTQSATNSNGAPMAFTLGADSITNISYANVYNGSHVSIPLAATPTTVITIDATTGFVDYVIPGIAGKAHPMAAQSTSSDLTYTGQFSAIYDGTGKNLAPSGATTVQIDRTTGKLLSFR